MDVHHMQQTAVTADGAEAWECPACGRCIILRWLPNYTHAVITRGNDTVAHSGGTGGIAVGAATTPTATATPEDHAWLADLGITWL